jgi:hypothetical protein
MQRRVTVTHSQVFRTGVGSSDKQIRRVIPGLQQAAIARRTRPPLACPIVCWAGYINRPAGDFVGHVCGGTGHQSGTSLIITVEYVLDTSSKHIL